MLKKKKLIKTTLCSAMLALSMNANAGIPTIDGAVLGQGLQELMEFVMQYSDQIEEWSEELSRYENLTTSIDASSMFSEMGIDAASFTESFGGSELGGLLSNVASNGVDGLSSGVMSKVKSAYPMISNPESSGDYAKNSVNNFCGLRDGLNLEIIELDKLYSKAQKKAIEQTTKSVEDKLKGSKEDESASVAAGVTATTVVNTSNLEKNEAEYFAKREQFVAERDVNEKKCQSATEELGKIVSTGVGFVSKMEALIFGVNKEAKSFEANDPDPRF